MRMVRKPLNLLVDEELVKKARDHGLVISKFLENKLIEYFSFIDAVSKTSTPYNSSKNHGGAKDNFFTDNSKSINSGSDCKDASWARGVAWYPCSFGSYRLEFKSQRAH